MTSSSSSKFQQQRPVAALSCMEIDDFFQSSKRARRKKEPLLLLHTDTDANDDEYTQIQQSTKSQSLLHEWWHDSVWPGLGLFGESYILFSIGTLTPLWQVVMPNCFVNHTTCTTAQLHSLSYAVVVGIILGMILLGTIANYTGRRCGSLITATLMSAGSIGLTLSSMCLVNNNVDDTDYNTNTNENEPLLVQCMAASLFIFGIGVGGEYPMAAASASEKAMQKLQQRNTALQQTQQQTQQTVQQSALSQQSTPSLQQPHSQQDQQQQQQHDHHHDHDNDDNHRGRKIQLVFTMQGMGIFCNSFIMSVLLGMFGQTNSDYNRQSLVQIWRITYALGTCILLYVLASRYLYLQESQVWKQDQQERQMQMQQIQIQQQQQQQVEADNNSTQQQQHQNTAQVAAADAIAAIPDIPLQRSPTAGSHVSDLSLPSVEAGSAHLLLYDPTTTTTTATTTHNHHHRASGNNTSSTTAAITTSSATLPMVSEASSLHGSPLDIGGGDNNQPNNNPNHDHDPTQLHDHDHDYDHYENNNDNSTRRRTSRWKVLRLFLRNYGMRLLGVSACWLLWDVAFYGNKLFQSHFILALTGGISEPNNNNDSSSNGNSNRYLEQQSSTTLLQFSGAATINAGVALLGYFTAALLVDYPPLGRRGLQLAGFAWTGFLFVLCGFLYPLLQSSQSTGTLVMLYFATSFFGQVGPNATTFLLPAEIFPTAVRTQCHGLAAASGKVGALIAAVWFPHLAASNDDGDNDDASLDLFLASGYASLAACAVTYWTIPETAGLDLYELDRKWRFILQGKKGDYHGQANQAQYLSPYERFKLILQQQQATHYNHAADAY